MIVYISGFFADKVLQIQWTQEGDSKKLIKMNPIEV